MVEFPMRDLDLPSETSIWNQWIFQLVCIYIYMYFSMYLYVFIYYVFFKYLKNMIIYACIFQIPLVPHKAVAEASKKRNL
jgi:hypothetical protein